MLRYVWAEGIALTVIWLLAVFWLGLALDYLPVLMGASEMPRTARVFLLLSMIAGAIVIAFRSIIRRLRVPLDDRNMAMLLERRFSELDDTLLTTVNLSSQTDNWSTDAHAMLDEASRQAEDRIAGLPLRPVFNFRPLLLTVATALLLIASVLVFSMLARDTCHLWASRLITLSNQPWPRKTHIEVIGFADGTTKVARGTDFILRVRADATRPTPPPRFCTVYYRTADKKRGRVNMTKTGPPTDGYQYYTLTSKPFQSILSDVRFDVVGQDHRVRDQRLLVVPSPEVVKVELACTLPAYTGLLPRRLTYAPGTELPEGTQIQVTVFCNKRLAQAILADGAGQQQHAFQFDDLPHDDLPHDDTPHDDEHAGRSFSYQIPTLNETTVAAITLVDTDGIQSTRPYPLRILATADNPPTVTMRLQGIGTAITPQARIPVQGSITDDYGVRDSWFQLAQSPDQQIHRYPLATIAQGSLDTALDLKELTVQSDVPRNPPPADDDTPSPTLQLPLASRVVLSVKASDHFNLGRDAKVDVGEPAVDNGNQEAGITPEVANVGESDRYELEVVAPEQLLAMLEAQELNLRRRLEQTVEELRQTRDSLFRIDFTEGPKPDDGSPPVRSTSLNDEAIDLDSELDTPTGESTDPVVMEQRAAALRLLRVQRAGQDSQRASSEVLGVALSLEDVCAQLVNNRIDAGDKRQRLMDEIASPLSDIGENDFAQLSQILRALESDLDHRQLAAQMAYQAVQKTDEIIIRLEQILERMLDLETYNELVDLVRSILDQQQDLLEKTKIQRKKRALDLLK